MIGPDVKKEIIVKLKSKEEMLDTALKIHRQLVGNEDYIESRIIVSMEPEDKDTENEVHVYIMNDSKTIPEIRI